jgi:hypothetical protein
MARAAQGGVEWRQIKPDSLRRVRAMLILKHGNLTRAAIDLGVTYIRISAALNGRENIAHIVAAIQQDLELTDEQVLALWPLLRRWPREVA